MPGVWLIFQREMRAVTRSPWVFVLRAVYPLALLAFVWSTYDAVGDRPMPGEVARRCCDTLMVTQLRAILLVTPLIVCGTFASERRLGTLDLLLTTSLSRTAVVVGKVGGRLAVVATTLLGGLLVMAFLMLSGDVSLSVLIGGTFQAAAMLLSVGAVSAVCAVGFRRAWVSAVFAWGVCLPTFTMLCGCLWAGVGSYDLLGATPRDHISGLAYPQRTVWGGLPLYLAGHFVVAATAFGFAIRLLAADPPRPRAEPIDRSPRRPIGDNPFTWLEWGYDPGDWRLTWPLWLVLGMLLGGCFLSGTLTGNRPTDQQVALAFGGVGALLAVVASGASAALSVTRERARRRLDDLRVLPDGPDRLLHAKWRAAMLIPWPISALTILGLLGFLAARLPLNGLLAIALIVAGQAVSAAIGLWASVRARGAVEAVGSWIALAGLAILLPGALLWPAFIDGNAVAAVAAAGVAMAWTLATPSLRARALNRLRREGDHP